MHLEFLSKLQFYKIFNDICFAIAILIPFVAAFEPTRNIDQQGVLLIISGVFAGLAIIFRGNAYYPKIDKQIAILLGLLVITIITSTVVSPHLYYDLIGAPYVRLASLGIISCMAIGLMAQTIPASKFIKILYTLICTIAAVSIPYSLVRYDTFERIGGIFAQADILAVFVGCGFLFGIFLLQQEISNKFLIVLGQILLVSVLIMTQTRVAILLVFLLSLLWIFQSQKPKAHYKKYSIILIIFVSIASILLLPYRVIDPSYAKDSYTYRMSLQEVGLKQSFKKPFAGYGIGNIADPLDCRNLKNKNLQSTCRDNYFFNSTHNIYLDRVLGFGWIGGLAYLAIVWVAVWRGLRGNQEMRILAFCTLLISIYYVTNVTSLSLELLLWSLIFQCLKYPVKSASRALA